MKKVLTLTTAALLITGVAFAHEGKGCGKGKSCCKGAKKECKKDAKKTTASNKTATMKKA